MAQLGLAPHPVETPQLGEQRLGSRPAPAQEALLQPPAEACRKAVRLLVALRSAGASCGRKLERSNSLWNSSPESGRRAAPASARARSRTCRPRPAARARAARSRVIDRCSTPRSGSGSRPRARCSSRRDCARRVRAAETAPRAVAARQRRDRAKARAIPAFSKQQLLIGVRRLCLAREDGGARRVGHQEVEHVVRRRRVVHAAASRPCRPRSRSASGAALNSAPGPPAPGSALCPAGAGSPALADCRSRARSRTGGARHGRCACATSR